MYVATQIKMTISSHGLPAITKRFAFLTQCYHLTHEVALTGFGCTHKIQAEEECLCKFTNWNFETWPGQPICWSWPKFDLPIYAASNVLCYECDSRYDPNCADPFDFSYSATLEPASQPTAPRLSTNNETPTLSLDNKQTGPLPSSNEQQITTAPNETSSTNIPQHRQPKKLPATAVCHGCCVKITSKSIDGSE